MGNRLYVGNLAYATSEDGLRNAFEVHGEVVNATVVMDRDTGRSRGFGFVEFADGDAAQSAMEALDGSDLDGRNIKVNEARERPRGGGGGGGRGPRRDDRRF